MLNVSCKITAAEDANGRLTLWRAGWVTSHSNTAPGVAACPLALELRVLLLPLHPGPDAERARDAVKVKTGKPNKPNPTKLNQRKAKHTGNNCGYGKKKKKEYVGC